MVRSRAFVIWTIVSSLSAPVALADPHTHQAGDADQLGSVSFTTSCSAESQAEFTRALAMLHSFWYPEAKNAFAGIAEREPDCAIAYWGVAMSLFHPLWAPPSKTDLTAGAAALAKADRARLASARERGYIAALAAYYRDHDTADHPTRAEAWRRAMEALQAAYRDDQEAAIFHALALLGTAPRTDTTYANQKKAATILEKIWPAQRGHPGVAHLLIHSYDSPAMAPHGVEAARAYATIAPAAAHALHMPSHIFSRLGLWEESAASNIASADAARRYTEAGKPSSGDEAHALDFLMNAYMQMRDLESAERVITRLRGLPPPESGRPVFYATVVIPARYLVEQGRWREAADVGPVEGNESTRALIHWIRGAGAARSGNLPQAREEAAGLAALAAAAKKNPDSEDAEEFEALQLSVQAWTALAEGRNDEALRLMRQAADLFDTLLYSYAPIPVREQLGDMLRELGRPAEALKAYETTLAARPGRFNSLFGAAQVAAVLGDTRKSEALLATLKKQAPKWRVSPSGAARSESQ